MYWWTEQKQSAMIAWKNFTNEFAYMEVSDCSKKESRMSKFYVQCGENQNIISHEDAREAAIDLVKNSQETLAELVYVSEVGFDSEEHVWFETQDLLGELPLNKEEEQEVV